MPIVRAENGTLEIPNSSNNWIEPFTFIQAADCQLGMEFSCIGTGGYGQGRGYGEDYRIAGTWEQEKRWCNSFVEMVNGMEVKPKFAVMCGDILDAYPEILPEVRERQRADFNEMFGKLDIPLVCVCGNHDVGNSPTTETVAKYRSDFGDDWFSFVCDGLFCIVLNSQYFADPRNVPELAVEQSSWLDEQLEIAKSGKYKHSVVFQHIPWFLQTPDEEMVTDKWGISDNLPQPLRETMLKKFYEAGISKIFCGHYHMNAGGWYNEELELIVTSAIGLQHGPDKNGFRVVSVEEKSIGHQYVELYNIDPLGNGAIGRAACGKQNLLASGVRIPIPQESEQSLC